MLAEGKPDYTALDLPSPPDGRPYVLVNMVSSVDGKVVIEGTEKGLGSKVDQRLMRELRVNADVVMNGAGTMRASGTGSKVGDPALERIRLGRDLTANPVAAVLTRSGDLPLDISFFAARDFDAVVYVTATTPIAKREAIEATGRPVYVLEDADHIAAMLRHMRRELKANVLLLEGGPTMNSEFFRLGFADELFVTIGPVIVGGERTLTVVEGPSAFTLQELRRLEAISVFHNTETSEIYTRYRVRYPDV